MRIEITLMTIGVDKLSYTPVVVITEGLTDPAPGWSGVCGIKLFHMAIYEVCGFKNVQLTKLVRFADGYTAYASVLYFK